MSDQSASSRLKVFFEAALRDYERQTGIALAKHPLAERLQECDSVESITTVLHEQTQAFNEFWGKEKITKSLKNVVSILCELSACAKLGEIIGMKFSPAEAVHSGLAVLLSVIKGVKDSYDALIELLESIEQLLSRLDICTKITPTVAMIEMLIKILVELLSTLALATKEVRQGKPKKFVKKLLGEKDVEAVLQRLDRLTQDEARLTATQTVEVVHGLVQNMRVMDDGKASLDCVRNSLETMNQIASDMNKEKRDKMQSDIRNWLSPPDPWKNFHIARESRHSGTVEWFIQGDTFSAWKASDPSSLLWIHGKPGAGKSVLCSSIIEDIRAMQKAGLASLAFFYFDFREDQKRDLRGLLSSLLVQLCHQSDSYCDILFKFYLEHAEGSQDPSHDELAGCLTDLLKLPGHAPVYLIIDALDDCPNISIIPSPRVEVLNLIQELIDSQFPDLRICVTSRPETDIKDVLDTLTFRSVSLHDEGGQKRDIEDFIKSVVYTDRYARRWRAKDRQLVMDVLTEKAHGMFRWVFCQLAYLRGCIPGRIQHALANLPETLDETYQQTLRGIDEANWKFAHRVFQFVAVASRPLRVEEVAELFTFDFKAGPIPKFHEDWRPEDPVDAVLSACSSLLAVVDVEGSPFIQFSHFSVKEFLTSARLAETNDIIHRYHVSMKPAHTVASQACLGTLLHLDEDVITRDSLKDFPLAEYAAKHWVDHACFEDVSRSVQDGMKQLFDPSKPHLSVSLWIYNPIFPMNERAERPLPPPGSPLHYAASWGLHSIVRFLVIGHLQDVHSRILIDNATPLHLASRYGHIEVAHFLLVRRAYVTAKNKDGETPLHLASLWGHIEVGHMLIKYGADLTAQNEDWEVPLHVASRYGQVEVARMLLEEGANLTAQNKDLETPLHVALRGEQVEVARMLLEHGADLTAQNENGDTPLHLVSRDGQVEVTRMLLEFGADLAAKNEDGETLLHLASRDGQVEVTRMLLEFDADLAAKNEDGETPLHLALLRGHVEVAHMLIERGADPTAQQKDGCTSLHLASRDGQVEVSRMLLDCGADPAPQNKDGETPLHLALLRGHMEVAHMLIEHGPDLTAQEKDGWTPLHLASQEGHVEVACMLIEHGADVSAQEEDGWTPLHLASRDGQVEIACMLIKHGAHVSAQEGDGWTPLHLASFNSQVEIVRLLIEHEADLTATNKDGETPLQLVSTPDLDEESPQRCVEVARILLEHNADVTRTNVDRLHLIWGCGIRGLQKFHASLSNMMPILARA